MTIEIHLPRELQERRPFEYQVGKFMPAPIPVEREVRELREELAEVKQLLEKALRRIGRDA